MEILLIDVLVPLTVLTVIGVWFRFHFGYDVHTPPSPIDPTPWVLNGPLQGLVQAFWIIVWIAALIYLPWLIG